MDREYDIREIRRLLGNPKEQRPGLDIIVSNMFASEQWMLTKQAGVQKIFTNRLVSVLTVGATAAYVLTPPTAQTLGKVIHVYREAAGAAPVKIPHIDFTNDADDVRFDFFVANPSGQPRAGIYRDGDDIKVHLQPTPAAGQAISVAYAAAVLDWESLTPTGLAMFQEFSRLRQVMAAIGASPTAEWEGLSLEENMRQRADLRGTLREEMAFYEISFVEYLKSRQAEAGNNIIARQLAENL